MRTTLLRLKRLRAWQSFGYSHRYNHRHTKFSKCEREIYSERSVIVAINATIIGHWIMMPLCPFSDLPERVRWENNWLSRNYRGSEWFDGEANLKYFTLQLCKITWQARYIYITERKFTIYVNYSPEMYII